MGINEEMTTDGRYGERLAVVHEKTAGSDILHKPGDANGMMEATSRDVENGREEGRKEERDDGVFGGGGFVAVDNVVFVSRLPC